MNWEGNLVFHYSFDDEEEAIATANATPFGLAGRHV